MWEARCDQASWLIQKILSADKYVRQSELQMSEFLAIDQFFIRKMYPKLKGQFIKVPWRRLVCNNVGAPKRIFYLRLVAHNRLYTRDRLASWGMDVLLLCPLCSLEQ